MSEERNIFNGIFTASNLYKLIAKGNYYKDFTKSGIDYILQKAKELTSDQSSFKKDKCSSTSPPQIKWGKDNEEKAIERYKKEEDCDVKYTGINQKCFILDVLSSNSFGNTYKFGAIPDGVCDESKIIEIKCLDTKNHLWYYFNSFKNNKDLSKHFPVYYYQIQGNLLATESQSCDLIFYDPRINNHERQILIENVERDIFALELIETRLFEAYSLLEFIIKDFSNKENLIFRDLPINNIDPIDKLIDNYQCVLENPIQNIDIYIQGRTKSEFAINLRECYNEPLHPKLQEEGLETKNLQDIIIIGYLYQTKCRLLMKQMDYFVDKMSTSSTNNTELIYKYSEMTNILDLTRENLINHNFTDIILNDKAKELYINHLDTGRLMC